MADVDLDARDTLGVDLSVEQADQTRVRLLARSTVLDGPYRQKHWDRIVTEHRPPGLVRTMGGTGTWH